MASILDFRRARSLFEIGCGFGVNVHLLVENYPELRKIVYLDIPPNLYVGTQYLKSIYEDSVQDYRATRAMDRVRFATPASDQLEILAIALWQIEKLALEVNIFYNAHSFVEMPPFVVSNYAKHAAALPGFASMSVALISYGDFDPASTLGPDTLPDFFPTKAFQRSTFSTLDVTSTMIAFVDPTGRQAR